MVLFCDQAENLVCMDVGRGGGGISTWEGLSNQAHGLIRESRRDASTDASTHALMVKVKW